MKKQIVLLIAILSILLASTSATADTETTNDTKVEVHVITDENLTAYINGEAGGDVNYYIDGIEVSEEFMALWAKINKLNKKIKDVGGTANMAWGYADNAYSYSNDNNQKIFLIRDELIAFENDYFVFKNNTNNTIGDHAQGLNNHANLLYQHAGVINNQGDQIDNQSVTLGQQGSMIDDLHNNNLGLQETVRAQSDQLEEMNSMLGLIKDTLIVLLIIGALIVLFYLLNRKYPFRKMAGKAKRSIKNLKRERQPDYVKSSKKAQTKKTLMYKIKHTHIKRNPERSPVKLFFSFLQIQK